MNKIIILAACLSIAAFAQQPQYQYPPQQQQGPYQQYPPQQQQYGVNTEQAREKVQKLIRAGLKNNKEEIQKESFYLSPVDKESLYNRNRKKAAAGWAALDFGVGFGVGSYIQGDIAFGVTQSIMDGLGLSLMYIGAVTMVNDIIDDSYECRYYDDCNYGSDGSDGTVMYISGLSIVVVSRIFSWIFPFVHQRKYNRALKSALNSNNVSYSIDPLIVPKNGTPALGLAFNISY